MVTTVRDLWATKQGIQRDARRKQVAGLALMGLPAKEIAERVGVHASTVLKDLRVIREQWMDEGLPDMRTLRLAEARKLDALEREAWAKKELRLVLQIIDRRCRLLGVDRSLKMAISVKRKPEEYSDEELAAIAGLSGGNIPSTGSGGTAKAKKG